MSQVERSDEYFTSHGALQILPDDAKAFSEHKPNTHFSPAISASSLVLLCVPCFGPARSPVDLLGLPALFGMHGCLQQKTAQLLRTPCPLFFSLNLVALLLPFA